MSRVIFGENSSVELCLSWHPGSGRDAIPKNAVDAGQKCYVARAWHKNEWVPGKLVPAQDGAVMYIPYGGKELPKPSYEVLVCTSTNRFGSQHAWVAVKDGRMPAQALLAGSDKNVPAFVARGTSPEVQGEMCAGKYVLGHEEAHVPWNGGEYKLDAFEVLVFK